MLKKNEKNNKDGQNCIYGKRYIVASLKLGFSRIISNEMSCEKISLMRFTQWISMLPLNEVKLFPSSQAMQCCVGGVYGFDGLRVKCKQDQDRKG